VEQDSLLKESCELAFSDLSLAEISLISSVSNSDDTRDVMCHVHIGFDDLWLNLTIPEVQAFTQKRITLLESESTEFSAPHSAQLSMTESVSLAFQRKLQISKPR